MWFLQSRYVFFYFLKDMVPTVYVLPGTLLKSSSGMTYLEALSVLIALITRHRFLSHGKETGVNGRSRRGSRKAGFRTGKTGGGAGSVNRACLAKRANST